MDFKRKTNFNTLVLLTFQFLSIPVSFLQSVSVRVFVHTCPPVLSDMTVKVRASRLGDCQSPPWGPLCAPSQNPRPGWVGEHPATAAVPCPWRPDGDCSCRGGCRTNLLSTPHRKPFPPSLGFSRSHNKLEIEENTPKKQI